MDPRTTCDQREWGVKSRALVQALLLVLARSTWISDRDSRTDRGGLHGCMEFHFHSLISCPVSFSFALFGRLCIRNSLKCLTDIAWRGMERTHGP